MVKSIFCFPKLKYISTQSVGLCTLISIKYTKPRSVYFNFNKVHKVSFCVLFLIKYTDYNNTVQWAVLWRQKVHKTPICVLMYFISVTLKNTNHFYCKLYLTDSSQTDHIRQFLKEEDTLVS